MTTYIKPNKNAEPCECDFNTAAVLMCLINARWCNVDPLAFRSWTGPRRIDGEPYTGPSYYYLTNTIAHGSEER